MALVYLQQKERMDIVLHIQQKGKRCDWSYLLKCGERGMLSFLSEIVPCYCNRSPASTSVWHMLWSVSEERSYCSVIALCPRRMRQIFSSLSFCMTVPGILESYLLRHICKRILESEVCELWNVCIFKCLLQSSINAFPTF